MIPEGWKLVPVEPTEEMFGARYSIPMDEKTPQAEWEAMLAAAPTPPAQEAEPVQRWRPTKGDINKIKMEVSPIGKYVRYSDYIKAVSTQSAPSDELRQAAEAVVDSHDMEDGHLEEAIERLNEVLENLSAAMEGKS